MNAKHLYILNRCLLGILLIFLTAACNDDDKKVDNSALTLLSYTPENGTSITSEGTVILTFSKNVRQASGTEITINDEATRVIITNNVVYCHYALPYADELTIKIPSGALTDMNGNQAFEGITLQYTLEIKRKLFDAVVDANGNGDYTTISQAIAAAPTNNEEPYLIFVADGNYNEMLSVSKPFTHLTGQSRENTRIQYAVNRTGNSDGTQGSATSEAWAYSIRNSASPARQAGYTTDNEAVLLIKANSSGMDFYGENLSIINLFGADGERYDGGLLLDGQADALMTRSDRIAFYNCRMVSYQDTWWVRMNTGDTYLHARNYADNCWIEGRTDYLYGNANLLVENSTFYNVTRTNEQGINLGGGPITAGSHYTGTKWGHVMLNCTVDGDDELKGLTSSTTTLSLGRPWQNEPVSVWINTTLNAPIKDGHWDDMSVLPKLYAEYNTLYNNQNIAVEENIKKEYLVNGVYATYEGPYVLNDVSSYTYENIIMGTDGWNPKEFYSETPEIVKSSIKLNGTTLTWEGSNTALCYLIFKQVNGKWQYVANTTENSCEVDDMQGTYDVRAANRYGSLSPAASL